jgi:hypothetical protein
VSEPSDEEAVDVGTRRHGGRRAAGGGALGAGLALLLAVLLDHSGAAAAADPAWTWPLPEPAQVVRRFDPPEHRYAAGHRGADLAGSPGAAVHAAGAGRVSYAGLLAGRGVVVVVHGDLRTTYEPVTAGVAVGQHVAAGEPLGRLSAGHEGCPVAACLHWGLRRGDTYLDPLQLVDAGPARLLPVTGAAGAVDAPAGPAGAHPPAAVRPAPPAAVAPDTAAPEATVTEPHWSLRAAEAPLGAAAVVALAAGLALITRPRRPPDGPATVSAAFPPPAEALPPPAPGAIPVDLDVERLRRRTG